MKRKDIEKRRGNFIKDPICEKVKELIIEH